MKIAVLLACYNRRDVTIKFLSSLYESIGDDEAYSLQVFLLDDASSDGTAESVATEFPLVNIVNGSGTMFWNGGMCAAYGASLRMGPFDSYLLVNDDVMLYPNIVRNFFKTYFQVPRSERFVLVGATEGSDADQITYAGFRRGSRFRATEFIRVLPSLGPDLRVCETFNANFVLIPGARFDDLGGLDPVYRHGYGDLDLGLRLQQSGVKSFIFGQPIGRCDKGAPIDVRIRKMGRVDRLRAITLGEYGLVPYLHFIWRHSAKALFPVFVARTLASRAVQMVPSSTI